MKNEYIEDEEDNLLLKDLESTVIIKNNNFNYNKINLVSEAAHWDDNNIHNENYTKNTNNYKKEFSRNFNRNQYISVINKKLSFYESQKTRNYYAIILISFCIGISLISDLAVQYYLKQELKQEPSSVSQILSIAQIPWVLKPAFGLLTDLVPVFGYRRKIYLFFSGSLSAISWYLLAYFTSELIAATMLLFIINCCSSFASVIGEGLIIELSQIPGTSKEERNNYISTYFLFEYSGLLISSLLKGYLMETVTINTIFLITSILSCLYILAAVISQEKKCIISFKKRDNILNELNMNDNNLNFSYFSIASKNTIHKSNLIIEFFRFLSNKWILVPCLLLIVFNITPNYNDAFFYYLIDELKMKPSCFGLITFYSTLATLFAILIYQKFFVHCGFKKLIIISIILSFVFSYSCLIIVKRENLRYDIPDYWLVILNNSISSILGELIILPMLSVACVLCPTNLEATVYSLFISSLSIGQTFANFFGALLTDYYEIDSNNYNNLGSLIMISNLIIILPLPFILFISAEYFCPEDNAEVKICQSKLEDSFDEFYFKQKTLL